MPLERCLGRQRLLRPLLGFGRSQLEAYARHHRLGWVDDASNADVSLRRNYLRHEILPALANRFPGVESSLAQAAAHFGEALALLDELAEADWQTVRLGEEAAISALRQLSVLRLKNLLRYRLRQLGWQVPVASRLEEFVRQLQSAAPDRHPELVLPAGTLRVARGRLAWLPHP